METKWRAKKLERYFYIDDRGRASTCAEINDIVDIDRYNSGNYYQTPQEAEAALRLREAAPKLLEVLELAVQKEEGDRLYVNSVTGYQGNNKKQWIINAQETIKQATK